MHKMIIAAILSAGLCVPAMAESQKSETVAKGAEASAELILPDALPDGRKIWNTDPEVSEYVDMEGAPVKIGGMVAKMMRDASIADEMCRGEMPGSDKQVTGCAVRGYLLDALNGIDICPDRYEDIEKKAFIRVYAQCEKE